MLLRTRKTARKSTGPIGVPHHQLAPRHEDSSSGSNDPIGDLEAQVEQLRTELHHRNDVRVEDSQRINELRTDIRHLQDQLAKRDLALNWVVNSRSLAWAKEAKARARVEEVHVLYSWLHPNVPVDPVGMGAGPSGAAGEGLGGELDLFRPLLQWIWLMNGLLHPTVKLPKVIRNQSSVV
jgi:hypothetical protein